MLRFLLYFWAIAFTVGYPIEPLATYVKPKLYNLEISLFPDGTFNGVVKILFNTDESTPRDRNITLNNEGLEIKTAFLIDDRGKMDSLTDIFNNNTLNILILGLNQPLEKNTKYELKLSYEGNSSQDGYGLYRFKNDKNYFMTNLHPIYARRVFPCFDSLDKKAAFSLIIDTQNNFVVSNMPLDYSKKSDKEGFTRYIFKKTPNISTNKLFFMVGPSSYEIFSRLEWGNVGIYIHPHFSKNKFFNDIIQITNSQLLSNLWSSSKMEKLDIFVVPNLNDNFFSGYGIVVLKDDLLQFDLAESTTQMKRKAAFTILEAILQVFFGSIVTPISYEKNWLSTSISSYLKYKAFNQDDNWGNIDQHILDVQIDTIKKSWNSTSDPVMRDKPFKTTESLERFIKGSSIHKGAAVLSMLDTIYSKEKLVEIIIDFMNKYQYKDGITENELFSIIQNSTKGLPFKVEEFLNPWIKETGVPKVTLSRNNGFITLTQTRYRDVSTTLKEDGSTWILPVSYTTTSNPIFNTTNPGPIWFLGQTNSINLKETIPDNDWVVINIDGKLPFVSNYDQQSWEELGIALRQNISLFTPGTRGKFINDAFRMGKEGSANYTVILEALTFLDDETSLLPWKLAINGFKEMYSWIYYTQFNTSTIPPVRNLKTEFENYVTDRLVKIYKIVGFDNADNDKEIDDLRREIISAMCYFGYEPCLTTTMEYYKNMIEEQYTPPNDMKSILYCTALRNVNNKKDWIKFYNQLFQTSLQDDILDIHLDVLACPSGGDTNEAIRKYLSTMLLDDNDFPVNKIHVGYKSIYSKAEHINQALYFLLDRQGLIEKIGPKKQAKLLEEISPLLWTEYQDQLLDDFIKIHVKADEDLLRAADVARVMIRNKRTFIQSNVQDIHRGLVSDPPSPSSPVPTFSTPTTPSTPSTTSTASKGTDPSSPSTNGTSTTTVSPEPADDSGLSTASIILISVGVIAFAVMIGLIGYFGLKKGC